MNETQINQFVNEYRKYFSESDMECIRTRILPTVTLEQATRVMNLEGLKSPSKTLILAFFGLDRFYLKDIVTWVFKALFYWTVIWVIADLFTAKKRTYQFNLLIFNSALSGSKDQIIIAGRVYTKKEAKKLGAGILDVIVSSAGEIKNAAKTVQGSMNVM